MQILVKEVPIEKIIEKIVEVPVEKLVYQVACCCDAYQIMIHRKLKYELHAYLQDREKLVYQVRNDSVKSSTKFH